MRRLLQECDLVGTDIRSDRRRRAALRIASILVLCLGPTACSRSRANLDEIQKMAYSVKPAVVRVRAYATAKVAIAPPKESSSSSIAPEGLTVTTGTGGSGSGFIIHPAGWVVTSAHVIEPTLDETTIRRSLLENGALAAIQGSFEDDVVRALARSGKLEAMVDGLIDRSELSEVKVVNRVDLSNGKSWTFDVKRRSPGIDRGGHDLALLRIPVEGLPTVPLSDRSVRLQENIWIAGYPAVASSNDSALGGWLSADTDLEPTITSGSITAIRKSIDEMTIYQTDAPIYPGHSGGPAVDRSGVVIGIPTWGHSEADLIRFLVPASTVRMFVTAAGVPLGIDGPFNEVYRDALDAASRGEWNTARKHLLRANRMFTGSPDVLQFLNEADRAGRDRGFLWTDGAAIVALLFALAILIIAATRFGTTTRPPLTIPPIREEITVKPIRGDRNGEEALSFRENGSNVLGTFTVLNGSEAGRRMGLGGSGIRIGRESRYCEIVLSDPKISRLHAEVVSFEGRTMLIDRNSSNGTFVNDERIERRFLHDGDIIYFGGRHAVAVAFTL